MKNAVVKDGLLESFLGCECAIAWKNIASFWGIALGIAIPFAINLSIRQAFPILYHIPWKTLAVGIVSLMCAVMFLTYLEINRQNGKNIIDEIKMDVM